MPTEEEKQKIAAHLNFHIASLLAEGNSESSIVQEMVKQGFGKREAKNLVKKVRKTLPKK